MAILPIINTEKTEPKTSAAQAGELVAAMQLIADTQSDLADWADFAVLIENEDNSSTVARRLEYPLTQECQLWHNMVYGNRKIWKTDKDGKLLFSANGDKIFVEPTDEQMKSRNVRFSARQGLAYWEDRMSQYQTDDHGQLIFTATHNDGSTSSGVINPDDDLSFANVQVKTEEARRWYAYALKRYNAAVQAYEILTGIEFDYKPFVERTGVANSAKNALALAASLRAK